MKYIILAAMLFAGCDTIDNSYSTKCRTTCNDDGTRCTTKCKDYDRGVIECQVYEDASQACISYNLDIDEVIAIYDAPEAMIDISDNEVFVETEQTGIIVEVRND